MLGDSNHWTRPPSHRSSQTPAFGTHACGRFRWTRGHEPTGDEVSTVTPRPPRIKPPGLVRASVRTTHANEHARGSRPTASSGPLSHCLFGILVPLPTALRCRPSGLAGRPVGPCCRPSGLAGCPVGPCWSPTPVGPCCLLVAPSGLAVGHRAARTLTVVVRVYEMLRLCVEMRMPITIVSPMVPITMVPITKVQTPA
jgi:hypothetical protein